jgi:hypothetical protein
MPSKKEALGRIVRMNDGNDSNHYRKLVIEASKLYDEVFFNTSIPKDLEGFGSPVVLTVNPGKMTDDYAHFISEVPSNLMFVRFRTNTWNLELCDKVVEYYSSHNVSTVLTFMAYYNETIQKEHKKFYSFRKRTTNSYWVINPDVWDDIMNKYSENQFVYSCGKNANTFKCSRCGTCLREYYYTKERVRS